MRVLHVNKFLYRRGGAEAYMLELAQMQRDCGHEVDYFGMEHPDNEPMSFRKYFPGQLEFDPPPSALRERLRLSGRMVWSTSARAGMEAVLHQYRPDIVHLHNIYHQLSPSVLAPIRKAGIPAVMTLHDYKMACPTYQLQDTSDPVGGPRLCTACVDGGVTQAVRRACKDGSRSASAAAAFEVWLHRTTHAYEPVQVFICPSQFLRDVMVRAGVFPERMQVLDNFTTAPPVGRVGPGAGLLYFGRLSREKGVDTLIEAFGMLAERRPEEDLVLHIAGDGPERAPLEQAARASGADVRFHGRLAKPELTRLLTSCRASVVPSRWHENQPLSVLESLAAGVPVVATNLGGLPDVVSHDRTGLLVDADAPAALAAALERYVASPDVAVRHGLAARSEAERRFSPALHLQSVLAAYESASRRLSGHGLAVSS